MAGTQPCSLASSNRLSGDPHEAATGSLQDSRAQTLSPRTHVSWDTLQLSHSDLQWRLVGPPPPALVVGGANRGHRLISHAFHSFAYMIAILPGCGATCLLANLVAQSSIETLVSLLSPVCCLLTPASFSIRCPPSERIRTSVYRPLAGELHRPATFIYRISYIIYHT